MKTISIKVFMASVCFVFGLITMTTAQQETRHLSDFTGLSVSGGISVNLHYGTPKAEVNVIKGDLEKLKTEVKGNTLKIYFEGKRWGMSNNDKAKIDLYFDNLNYIDVSAGANVECNVVIKADDFDVDVSSGGRLDIEVEAASIDSDVSSGASINITGKADELNVDASSGASFRGAGLMAKNVDADVSSGGNIKVWATEEIHADASSGGSVQYKGEPKKVNIDSGKWSGGNVSKM